MCGTQTKPRCMFKKKCLELRLTAASDSGYEKLMLTSY